MTPRNEVYKALDSERDYQDVVWPDSAHLSIGDYLLMLEEYVFRGRREWVKEHQPELNALEMIRKVGGIAVRCMEQHGAPIRVMPNVATSKKE